MTTCRQGSTAGDCRSAAGDPRAAVAAAENAFAELGYHEASIVKITEAAGVGQGTFYLYFTGKKEIFDEVVIDLNHRVRQAMTRSGSSRARRASRRSSSASRPSSASQPSIRRSTASSGRPSSSRRRPFSSTTSG